jgi:hypothetical protein
MEPFSIEIKPLKKKNVLDSRKITQRVAETP